MAMITGDNAGTAKRIADELGINIVIADVLPGDKAAKIKELQAQGHRVGMVGDGVNDAPALTQADVGFAIGAGTDVAIESADVVLMKSDLFDIVGAISLSRATLRKMHQNLWWAVGNNVIAFPLAAGLLYPFLLSPEIAALAMSGSSALVAVNALMLKRTRLGALARSDRPRRWWRRRSRLDAVGTGLGARELIALLLSVFVVSLACGSAGNLGGIAAHFSLGHQSKTEKTAAAGPTP